MEIYQVTAYGTYSLAMYSKLTGARLQKNRTKYDHNNTEVPVLTMRESVGTYFVPKLLYLNTADTLKKNLSGQL